MAKGVSVYEIVQQKLVEKLESGTAPWRKPWSQIGSMPVSWRTQKPYRGINTLLLDPGEYITFKQATEIGATVKKGAKSEIVVFWKFLEKEDRETGEVDKIPMLRYYRVFNILDCEGVNSKRPPEVRHEHEIIADAEAIVDGYVNAPQIDRDGKSGAWYMPKTDIVSVPNISLFEKAQEYYSTLFHELVHSTGHESRLARPGIMEVARFGDETYSREELVAEMGAGMLCGIVGIDNDTLDNSASYLSSWIRVLKGDSKLAVQAAGAAQKAADHIRGITFGDKSDEEAN